MKNLLIFICFLSALCFAQNDPRSLIIKKDTELKKAIGQIKQISDSTKQDELKKITFSIFDFNILAQTVVPKTVWDTCDNQSRKEFIQAFKSLIENSSIQKLEMYKTDSTIYDTALITGKKASIKAHLWKSGSENILIYKMTRTNDEWKVVDLIINDLSTARNYREQFTTLFTTKTIKDVINLLRCKSKQQTGPKI